MVNIYVLDKDKKYIFLVEKLVRHWNRGERCSIFHLPLIVMIVNLWNTFLGSRPQLQKVSL